MKSSQTEEAFYPIETAEAMIAAFEDCSLPPEEWDHGTHLVMGLYMIARYKENAYAEIKKRLIKYVGCLGKDGYHETMTQFWTKAIRHFRKNADGKLEWTQTALDGIIFDDELTRRNLWADYYSKELMMSERAKTEYVEPDLKEL